MQRGLAMVALLGALVLFSGCTEQLGMQSPEELAMSNATVKLFMGQYPNATVSVTRYDKDAFANIADEIKADCANPYFNTDTPREFYKVVVNDAASGDYIKAWVDGEAKKIECFYRKGQKAAGETKKGTEGGAEKCVAGWACRNSMHKAYRNEDCNWEGEKFCDYGCGAGRCLASDEEGAKTGENAGPCAGVVCSDVCDGGVRKYNGQCVDGDCNYSVTTCTLGCENGFCKGDPCAGVVCPNTCDGDAINRGKCVSGSCTYEQIACPYGCQDGGCKDAPADEQENQDLCAGVSCADKCEGNTRKHTGQCINGGCQYASEACANGCENGECKAAEGKPVGTIFIANAAYAANLGGISGADAKCAERATAAGLSGTWKALISDSATNAKDRIPDTVYKRMDGTVIANSKADLFDGSIQSNIELTELGTKYTIRDTAWTGSTSAGAKSASNCANWTTGNINSTGVLGHGAFTDVKWIAYLSTAGCGNVAALYCVKVSDSYASYTCNWVWWQQIWENGVGKWICTSARPYCNSGTTNCCKHTDTQGYYDCIDCTQGGCTNCTPSTCTAAS